MPFNGIRQFVSFGTLGAGLGGPSRAIIAAYGIWVTALEWEAGIAAAGMEQSIMHGLGRKGAHHPFRPRDGAETGA